MDLVKYELLHMYIVLYWGALCVCDIFEIISFLGDDLLIL